jgi:hypothetical protein
VGALGSAGIDDLRRTTTPIAPAEAGGAPEGAGGIAGERTESARVGHAMGRSEEQATHDGGTHAEMAEAANAEWGRRMAAWCYEVRDRRASGEIFL